MFLLITYDTISHLFTSKMKKNDNYHNVLILDKCIIFLLSNNLS